MGLLYSQTVTTSCTATEKLFQLPTESNVWTKIADLTLTLYNCYTCKNMPPGESSEEVRACFSDSILPV